MARKRRIDIPGTLHHVIVRGIERKKIFIDNEDNIEFLLRLENGLEKAQCQCFAWVLMGNHFHLLIRIGTGSLSKLMRSLLTGYAIYFNRKYKRSGYVYQNRYKSILCHEEPYFLELVRYIHLNPLRNGLVKNMQELSTYPWCGHSVVLGNRKNNWQEVDEILKRFSIKYTEAKMLYKKFIYEGREEFKKENLIGGGLRRSAGGWSERQTLQKSEIKWRYDDRILGEGSFVEEVLKAMEEKLESQEKLKRSGITIEKVLDQIEKETGIKKEKIISRDRKKEYVGARALLSYCLNEYLGISGKEIGDLLNISRQASILNNSQT